MTYDTHSAFFTEDALRTVARKLGIKPSTLRARWVSEFGVESVIERARQQHRKAARVASMSRVRPVIGGEKTCVKCQEEKPLVSFDPNPNHSSGCSSWCSGCRRQYNREYSKTWRRPNEDDRKSLISSHKDQPCADCGLKFPTCAMDFDHIRGEKVIEVSSMKNWSIDKLLTEIGKCEVVCSNCHRIRTHARRQGDATKFSEVS